MGIEPTLAAWEAAVLPLNYTRTEKSRAGRDGQYTLTPARGTFTGMPPARHATDVAIAGAGLAGITAALEALARGRRVLLIDRDSEENLGGLARESFGGLWFAGTPLQKRYRIRDSVELGLQDWLAWGELGSEHQWPRAWAKAYVERCIPEIHD